MKPVASPGLVRRAVLTVGVLLVVRLGRLVPLPGLDPEAVAAALAPVPGATGWALAGGSHAMGRLSVFALGLTPMIAAFAAALILDALARGVRRAEGGPEGIGPRRGAWTRGLTAAFALVQALGVADALQGLPGLVPAPGPAFLAVATLTLTAGALLLAWLAERISAHGLGVGVVVILAADLVAGLPAHAATAFAAARRGGTGGGAELPLALALVAALVLVERARRRVPVAYGAGRTAALALQPNPAGPLGPILAYALLPYGLAGLNAARAAAGLGHAAAGYASPLHLTAAALAVPLATLACAARSYDPGAAAADLARAGGAVPGVPPGPATAAYLDGTATRLTLLGAVGLAGVCAAPEALALSIGWHFALTGYGLFLVAWTALDLLAARGVTPPPRADV